MEFNKMDFKNVNVLSEEEILEINGGGPDLSTDLGTWFGGFLSEWGYQSDRAWEACKKAGIKSRRDC